MGKLRIKRGLGAKVSALKYKLEDEYHGDGKVFVDLSFNGKVLYDNDKTLAEEGITKDTEIEYNLIPLTRTTITNLQQQETKETIKILLKSYDWFHDRQIILNYAEKRDDKSLSRLNSEFNFDWGFDLSEYLSDINAMTHPQRTHSRTIARHLFCQWAVSKSLDPLMFLKLWMNYKGTPSTNPIGNEWFKELLGNPDDYDKIIKFKRAIFPFIFHAREGSFFNCSCGKCVSKETGDYPGIILVD